MTTAKITSVKSITKWEKDGNVIYFHKLELDNGETIDIGKKQENAFKDGESIDYEIVNGKAKEVRQNNFQKGGFKPVFKHNAAGFAMSYAKDLVIADKIELKDLSGYADKIFEWLMKHE